MGLNIEIIFAPEAFINYEFLPVTGYLKKEIKGVYQIKNLKIYVYCKFYFLSGSFYY